MSRLLCPLLAVLFAALLVAPAFASFRGANGRFAVTLSGCEESHFIRAYTTGGRAAGDLTPRCERLGQDDVRDTYAPEWTADGARLLHVEAGVPGGRGVTLASVDATGGDRREHGPLPRFDVAPSPSPGGTRVAYSDDGSVVVAALDGSRRRVLRAKSCSPRTGCRVFRAPRWSPDGRRLAVLRDGWGPAVDGLWIMDAASGRLVRRLARGASEPDWSPDGRALVFRTRYEHSESTGAASGGNLYVVRADGRGRPRRLVHRERIAETSPVFAPDGRWIAWVSLRFTAGDVGFRVFPSLWRVRATGGRPQKLAVLPEPWVDEGFFDAPDLAWQPLPR